jgi:hypothetical protein
VALIGLILSGNPAGPPQPDDAQPEDEETDDYHGAQRAARHVIPIHIHFANLASWFVNVTGFDSEASGVRRSCHRVKGSFGYSFPVLICALAGAVD